jgi:GAF domain-containing protein
VATEAPERDPRFDPEVDTAEDGCARPLLCLPLRLRGQVVGLCRVFLSPGETPSARTGEMLAAALSAAVRNVLLYRSLVESIEEVAEARRQARP